MPTNKNMKKLLKASEAASHTDTQHLVLSVSAEGRVHASGTDNLVTGIIGDMMKSCSARSKPASEAR